MSDSKDSMVTYTAAPPSLDYVPGPEYPPLPDFVPEPVYPEFMLLEDEDPEEDDDEDPEEDPADYPSDGSNDVDDEDESSDDDEDDDVDIEGDEKEEEHPAPADSTAVALPAVDQASSAEETEPRLPDSLAIPTPPPSPLSLWSSPYSDSLTTNTYITSTITVSTTYPLGYTSAIDPARAEALYIH
ncbi:hypothetical protein Tco_0442103 [Tanacetum coccineum]